MVVLRNVSTRRSTQPYPSRRRAGQHHCVRARRRRAWSYNGAAPRPYHCTRRGAKRAVSSPAPRRAVSLLAALRPAVSSQAPRLTVDWRRAMSYHCTRRGAQPYPHHCVRGAAPSHILASPAVPYHCVRGAAPGRVFAAAAPGRTLAPRPGRTIVRGVAPSEPYPRRHRAGPHCCTRRCAWPYHCVRGAAPGRVLTGAAPIRTLAPRPGRTIVRGVSSSAGSSAIGNSINNAIISANSSACSSAISRAGSSADNGAHSISY